MIRPIHTERDFLVLDKPAGIAVHRGAPSSLNLPVRQAGLRRASGVRAETIADWLVTHYPETKSVGDDPAVRPGIVHRLDKDTSGLMLAARSQPAFQALKRLFAERRVEKTYLALVAGAPKTSRGAIDMPIGRSRRVRTKRAVGRAATSPRAAFTEYRALERLPGHTLLAVRPKTGRMHQIRVHLASIGHPVAGDRMYGGRKAELPGLGRQFLHAWRLEFSYPEGRRWRFEAPLPADLDSVLKRLRRLRRR